MGDFADWLGLSPPSLFIKSVPWIIPAVQTVHIVTVGVVFVSMLMIALRVLGAARADQPIADVARRFVPFLRGGLAVMTVTGLVLVLGEPKREFFASSFWAKMALLAVAISTGAAFLRAVRTGKLAGDAGAAGVSAPAKAAVAATLVVWLAIIFFGRAIAYDVEVWGPWSLTSFEQGE